MTESGPITGGAGNALATVAEALDLLGDVFARSGADARSGAAQLLRARRFDFPSGGELAASLSALAAAGDTDLEVEYARLFLHGRPATAHPYESFYRSGRLMDPECLDALAALFSAAGVTPEEGDAPPDHVSVEAGFLALLLRGLAGAAGSPAATEALRVLARELLATHLRPFAFAFRAQLAVLAPAAPFARAADALARALDSAGVLLGTAEEAAPAPPRSSPARPPASSGTC